MPMSEMKEGIDVVFDSGVPITCSDEPAYGTGSTSSFQTAAGETTGETHGMRLP